MSAPPWEQWNLDAKFLEDLSRWEDDNPESRVDKVLDKLCSANERGKEFFELIPDGTFPARGLFMALAHLVLLAKEITSANREIFLFTNEVVQWIKRIQRAFAANKKKWIRRSFTRQTWENLQEMRDIIDDICQWAAKCLFDSHRPFWEKLKTSKAIETFKNRMTEARKVFHDLEIIKQSQAIDIILNFLHIMRKDQKKIFRTIHRMKSEQQRQLNEILAKLDEAEAKFQEAEAAKERRKEFDHLLSKQAVQDPTHEAQGKRACAKETRLGYLDEIKHWASDVTSSSGNFLWLTGDPGCGKSAITASLVEHSRDNNTLWAEFFINRNNRNTTNPNSYFPTIVHQFAKRLSPEDQDRFYDQLLPASGNMSKFPTTMSSEQAQELFVKAIYIASRLNHGQPIVIIIDGLDETDKIHLGSTATIISNLFASLSDCPNAKVFISSQTEDEIRNPFAHSMQGGNHVKKIHLDTTASFDEVASYMCKSLMQIWKENTLPADKWPKDEVLDSLANHASGLFIWAVTAIEFFRQQVRERGHERLSFLLNDLTSKGSLDINALYGYIIIETYSQSGTADDSDANWVYETFRRLVGAIVVLSEPLPLGDLGHLLNLRQPLPASTEVDVIQFARRLRTILINGTEAVTSETIPRLHRSFIEYVTSDQIDNHFQVDVRSSHCELGICCLIQLTQVHLATASYWMPAVFRYASRFWLHHLSSSELANGILSTYPITNIHDIQSLKQMASTKISVPPTGLVVSSSSVIISVLDQTCAWDINSGLIAGGVSLAKIKLNKLPKRAHSRLSRSQAWVSPPAIVGTLPSSSAQIGWALARDQIGLWDINADKEMLPLTTFSHAK
ncbi:hypothetical protein H2248_003784 [Termitomyces sp. 'cryptogamus']|nr:hypothetical protein H2248_003784 [Termitomyces sp. 'cryptogamus']